MPKKGTFVNDTFERLNEFVKKTEKSAVSAVVDTLNPLTMVDKVTGFKTTASSGIEQKEKEKNKTPNHTPLNFDRLTNSFGDQDKAKTAALRQRLHQIVINADERLLLEDKQKKQQKEQEEIALINEKRKREEEQWRHPKGIPHGRIRNSVLSRKKVVQREQTEVRPASGKQ